MSQKITPHLTPERISDSVERLAYESPVLATVHETIEDLYEIGLVDEVKMREFDEACLVPVEPINAAAICALRAREDVSQIVLAHHLGVPLCTVERWERGEEEPGGAALRLLALIDRKGLGHLT